MTTSSRSSQQQVSRRWSEEEMYWAGVQGLGGPCVQQSMQELREEALSRECDWTRNGTRGHLGWAMTKAHRAAPGLAAIVVFVSYLHSASSAHTFPLLLTRL